MNYKILITDEKRGHIIVKAYVSGNEMIVPLSEVNRVMSNGNYQSYLRSRKS